jgi:ribosomal protein S5
MIYDILIGIIIGIGLERALKVSHAAQKAIKQAKDARRAEAERKKKLLEESEK